MKRLALTLGLAGFLVSGVAFAGWSTNTGVKITQVEADSGTNSTTAPNGTSTWIGFSSLPNNRPGCATGSQAVVAGTAEHIKAVTSLATAAFLAGRTVRVNWSGNCTSGYGHITHLLVE